MEIIAKVKLLLEPKSGVSQATGNAWMSQNVVFDYFWWPNQQQASQVVMKVFGEDRIKEFNLQPNDEVKVRFHMEAHEYNGQWYNDLRVDGVTFVGASASKTQQQAGTTAAAADATSSHTPPQTDANGSSVKGEGDDDLPF